MLTFDEKYILVESQKLSLWQRIAFMAYCCERMLPNYIKFFEDTSAGYPQALRTGLDRIWAWIESDVISEDIFDSLKACDGASPSTEWHASTYTSAALDAANAVAITLDELHRNTGTQQVDVASLARDTIDIYIQNKEEIDPLSNDFEGHILANVLMQKELEIQNESIRTLASLSAPRSVAAIQLRRVWSNLTNGSLDEAEDLTGRSYLSS
jgi:uncharacterized protein